MNEERSVGNDLAREMGRQEMGGQSWRGAWTLFAVAVTLLTPGGVAPEEALATAATGAPSEAVDFQQTLDQGRRLLKDGKFGEVEAWARALLPQIEARHRADSIEAANVLDLLVKALWRGGKAKEPEAREFAERAIGIKERTLGPDHPDVAPSLNNLANLLSDTDDYARARQLYQRALSIREKALGPDHPDVAGSLNNLADLLRQMGDYAQARPLHERALSIREKALGPDHPDVAGSLNNLAELFRQMGDYVGARPLYERALSIMEKALGPDHLDVAKSTANLAILLYQTGDYGGARPLYERALRIMEKALGPDHPVLAPAVNALAVLLYETGDYAGARPLYERGLKIREKALGPEHPEVGQSLNNLGFLLYEMGDYAGARPLLERALNIREKALGPEHPDVGQSLDNLAMLLSDTGDYAGARPLYERALGIWEKALGPDHPDVAMSLNDLASLLYQTGDYAGARPLYDRALKIREKALGPDHPDVAVSLNNLANLLRQGGDNASAKTLCARALRIREKALGPDHPDVAQSLNNLANLLYQTGDQTGALGLAVRAEKIGREQMRDTVRTLSERQALRYQAVRASGLNLALSLALQENEAPSRQKAWDALIRSRALVLDEMAARHRAVGGAEDPEVARLASALFSARQRLANLAVRGPGEEEPERYRSLFEGVRREKEEAERALAAKSAGFRQEQARNRVGLTEVASALSPGNALVAFARFERYELIGKVRRSRERAGGGHSLVTGRSQVESLPSYLAFVLRGGESVPVLISLGAAEEFEAALARWSEEATRGVEARAGSGKEADAAYRIVGQALRRKIWDPIAAHLKGTKQVFVVPDGALNLVNLAAFPVKERSYLIETGLLIHYLSAERDLVPVANPPAKGEGLLALGGPAFDQTGPLAIGASRPPQPAAIEGPKVAAVLPFRGGRSACDDFRSMRFGPLPSSEQEAGEVVALWKQAKRASLVYLSGAEASEAALKATAPAKHILHLATHGFFLGGRCRSALDSSRGVGGLTRVEEERPPLITGENPLLLSGLALAGANHRHEVGPDEDDGILTAEEIASLNLDGVEWAVLSACDTGVGEVKAGEGVFGLRRAFQIAGARTVIMSLWSVEDEAARQWMKVLYESRLRHGLATSEAVREASLKVLRGRRAKGESTHPFYWGAFVAAGDWR